MIYTGKIYDIIIVNEKVAKILLKKKVKDKIIPIAIDIFGYWKDKALKEMQIKVKDKIRGKLNLRSNFVNNKWYTDVYFEQIFLVQSASVKFKRIDVNNQIIIFDKETGEIVP